MIQIPAAQIEFVEGGNTIWIHGPEGATILRIKTMGKIKVHRKCENVCSHADMIVQDDIEICLADDAKEGHLNLILTDKYIKEICRMLGVEYHHHDLFDAPPYTTDGLVADLSKAICVVYSSQCGPWQLAINYDGTIITAKLAAIQFGLKPFGGNVPKKKKPRRKSPKSRARR